MLRPRPSSTSRFVIFCLELASSSSTLRTASKLTPLTWKHNQYYTIKIRCFHIGSSRIKTERATEMFSCPVIKRSVMLSLEPGSVIPSCAGRYKDSKFKTYLDS